MRVYSIFSCGFDYVIVSSFLSTNAITTSVRLKNTNMIKSVVTQTLTTTSLL